MENASHQMTCDLCGQSFDLRNLSEVSYHLHPKEEIKVDPGIKGVRVYPEAPSFATLLKNY